MTITSEQDQHVRNLLERGYAQRGWYENTSRKLDTLLGPAARFVFVRVLAATSANTTVAANVTIALTQFKNMLRGDEFNGVMPAVRKNLELIRDGKPPTGPKIGAFERALNGDSNSVVVDRWMHRAYGWDNITPRRREAIEAHVTKLAKEYFLSPREAQAAIWFGAKSMDTMIERDERPYEEHLLERLDELIEDDLCLL